MYGIRDAVKYSPTVELIGDSGFISLGKKKIIFMKYNKVRTKIRCQRSWRAASIDEGKSN